MTESEETDVRTCIDLYATVWDLFRTRTFGREELGRTLLERDDHRRVAADADLRAVLSRLVEFGLLEDRPDGFRVAVRPDDVPTEMPESASLRTEAVRRLVRSSLAGDSADGDGDATLSRDDESYAVVELGAGEAVTSGVRRVASAAEGSDHRGVVVTTPGTNADAAQRVGDQLTEKRRGWEKAGSNVVTGATDDDELVFRLYLDCLPDESAGE